jgi:hypothetical protein
VSRAQSLRIVRVAAALGVAVLLASCAATQKTVGGWIASATPTPSPRPKAASGAQAPRAYYAQVEGLKVYSESSSSSKVVGTLSLHEKVTRYKVERGYALVESAKSGLKGWVDNAQLTWRLPAAPVPAEARPEEAIVPQAEEQAEPEEPTAPEGEETQVPPPEASATATHPMPTTTPVPTAPPSSMPTPRVGPSIFNPY